MLKAAGLYYDLLAFSRTAALAINIVRLQLYLAHMLGLDPDRMSILYYRIMCLPVPIGLDDGCQFGDISLVQLQIVICLAIIHAVCPTSGLGEEVGPLGSGSRGPVLTVNRCRPM